MSPEHRRLTHALLLSLLIHAWLLNLTFGGQGLWLPGFGFPWQDRRIEAPDLRVAKAAQEAGIYHDEIVPLVSSPFHPSLADADDIRLGSLRLIDSMHVDLKVVPKTRQLVAGCRTTRICRNQEHPFPLSLEVPPELAASRCLSSTLESYHQNDSRGIRGQSQTGSLAAHHLPQLLPHDLDDLMTRGQALEDFLTNCLFADSLDEVLDDEDDNQPHNCFGAWDESVHGLTLELLVKHLAGCQSIFLVWRFYLVWFEHGRHAIQSARPQAGIAYPT